MIKISKKPIEPKLFGHYVNNLWNAFTLSGTKEDIKLLFKDLFTHTEYKMFAKRLEIARRLLRHERYKIISDELNVTSKTITSISNILTEKGQGLRKVHENLEKLEDKYLQKQRDIVKNLENPFRQKVKQRSKTVLGAVIKAGLIVADNALSKYEKDKTTRQDLPV